MKQKKLSIKPCKSNHLQKYKLFTYSTCNMILTMVNYEYKNDVVNIYINMKKLFVYNVVKLYEVTIELININHYL